MLTRLCFKEWLTGLFPSLGNKGQDKGGSNKNRKEVMLGDAELTKKVNKTVQFH